MTHRQFFTNLAAVTGCTSVVLALLHQFLEPFRQHWGLSILTLAVFVLLSIGLYFAGLQAVRSKSKVAFNGIVSGSVFGKMLLAIGLLFAYQSAAQPTNQWFVAIFLLVYVVFTVFEVWFMSLVARMG
jgi:hypothetical protein